MTIELELLPNNKKIVFEDIWKISENVKDNHIYIIRHNYIKEAFNKESIKEIKITKL